jgi:uncharacterized membrane protein (UPF0127 family)
VTLKLMKDGQTICNRLGRADSFSSRLRGWMFRVEPSPDDGLLIPHCASIHSFFMRFPMDVIFTDKDLRIVKIVSGLKPWRVCGTPSGAHTLELPAGAAARARLAAGDQLGIGPEPGPGGPR